MFLRTVELAFARFQAKGEAKALAIVFDRTAPELLRVARHLAPQSGDAEDLVQATFLTAIESKGTHQRGRPVLPWLLGILANHARATRRSTRRKPDPARVRGDVVADVDSDVAAAELQRELSAAIADLPEAYRPVLRMWFEHGLEAQEIATTLERPPGTVRAQISRGIEMLRRVLPHSLAGATAVAVVTGSGLAAVRTKVLAGCTGTSAGLASAFAIGGLMMLHNKLMTMGAVAVLVLGSFGAYSLMSSESVVPASNEVLEAAKGEVEEQAEAAPVEHVERAPVEPAANAPDPEEPSPPAPATLIVRLRSAGDQTPLVGYGVGLRRSDDLANFARRTEFFATDSEGVVRFENLEPTSCYIEVDRVGAISAVWLREGEVAEKVVDVPDSVVVVGQVIDQLDQPVAGAHIVVQGSRLAAPTVGVTDAHGRFEVHHINGVELQAKKRGFAPSLAHLVKGDPGQRIGLELQIGAAGRRLTGRAFDFDGDPVPGAAVAIVPSSAVQVTPWDREKPQVRPVWLRTDRDGHFATDEVAAGEYLVVACPADLGIPPSWGTADTSVADAHVELRSDRPTVIEGTIDLGGDPLPGEGIRVSVFPEKSAAEIGYLLNLVGMRNHMVDQSAEFRIVGVLPGELVITAHRGMELIGQHRRTVAAGETTRCDFALTVGAELKIAVEASGELPPQLVAFVYDNTVPNQAPSMKPFIEGMATYTGARTGDVLVVIAQLLGGRNLVQLARRSVPQGEDEVRFELNAGQLPVRSVRGRLVDQLMAPMAATSISVRRVDGEGLAVMIGGVTAADGTFELGPLPAGHYQILTGEMRSAVAIGDVVLTSARDEDLGDLKVGKR